jgi:hypothetical protein
MFGRFAQPRTPLIGAGLLLLLGIVLASFADTTTSKVAVGVLTLCYVLPTVRWSIRRARTVEENAPHGET